MTREEAIKEYVIPALRHTWNEKINKKVLEALEQEPKWIPVSEKLPKYEAKVITCGNCMMCGKELTEGLFFCKECGEKAVQGRK